MSNPGARRVVTSDSARAPRRRLNFDRLRKWRAGLGPAVGGVLVGIQAVLITFLTITIPAIATYVAASGDPDLAETGWWDALHVGTDIWLLGHGGGTELDGAPVSVFPLGITLLALLATAGLFRRAIAPTRAAWATAVLTYPVTLVLLGAVAASGPGRASLWRAGLGALVIALIGTTTGWTRHDAAPKWEEVRPGWLDSIPTPVAAGLRGGALALCVLLGAAGLLATAWIFQGQAQMGDVLVGLGGDWLSVFILGIAQLLLVPNLVLWAFAWLSGAGFTVGEATLWAPDTVLTGPLPALPILGALPEPESFLPGGWIYLLSFAVGVLAVIPVARRHPDLRWYWSLAVSAIITTTAAGGALLLAALGAGSLGPGRMAHIGPHAGQVFVHIALPVLLATLVTAFITGQHAHDGWQFVSSKVRRTQPEANSPAGAQTDSKSDQSSTSASSDPQKPSHIAPAPPP